MLRLSPIRDTGTREPHRGVQAAVLHPQSRLDAGHVAVVDLASKAVTATCELEGQPDSVALSPDGATAFATAIDAKEGGR